MWVSPLAFQSMDAQSLDAVLLIEKTALTKCWELQCLLQIDKENH
jgi:hypothetical protein